jgi:hypothetical protein
MTNRQGRDQSGEATDFPARQADVAAASDPL